jgi:hypothetical protein
VISAFREFLKEVERAYPHSFEAGEFSHLSDLLSDLSNETTSAGIRLSDMAVELARKGSLVSRIYILEKLVEDLRKLGSPEAVCAARLP